MKKTIKIIFLTLICCFLCALKVKADSTNYSGGTVFKNSRECAGNYCLVENNTNYLIIQARLYYLSGSNLDNIGKTYYFVNTSAYNYLKDNGLNLIEIEDFNSYSGENRYSNAINLLSGNNYLNKENYVKDLLNKIVESSDYTSVLNKDITTSTTTSKGYRIILEPAFVVSNVLEKTNTAIFTSKGIAAQDSTKLSSKLGIYYNQVIKVYDDNSIDIDASLFKGSESLCKTYNNQTLADSKVRCLYKMYNVDKYINTNGNYTCYTKNIETDNGGLTCSKWDSNNEETYTETYTATTCKLNIEERRRNTIYGEETLADIGTCRLYCKEKATLSFPSNISIPKLKGTYFAWPANGELTNKLEVKTTVECTVVDDEAGGTNTVSAVAKRNCPTGYTNHPTDPDKCISNATTSKICPSGTREVSGKCYSLSNPTGSTKNYVTTSTRVCPSNTIEKNGKCYVTQSVCPSGYTYIDGSCYKIVSANTSSTRITAKKVCPSVGETHDNGDDTCFVYTGGSCPSGYTFSKSDGKCHKTSESCGWYCSWYRQYDTYGECAVSTEVTYIYSNGSSYKKWVYPYEINHSRCSNSNAAKCCEYCFQYKQSCKTTSDTQSISCPSGYSAVGPGWPTSPTCYNSRVPKVCPTGYQSKNGVCAKNGEVQYTKNGQTRYAYCSTGYSFHSETGKHMDEYGKATVNLYEKCTGDKKSLNCPSSYIVNGKCPTTTVIAKNACPSGYTKVGSECRKTVTPYCENGTQVVNGKCCIGNTVVDKLNNALTGKCRSKTETKKVCSSGYYDTKPNDNTGVCRLITTKNNVEYACSESYTKSDTACINNCTSIVKENYKTRIEEKIKNPNTSILLNVEDSTEKINNILDINNIEVKEIKRTNDSNGELKTFAYESTYKLTIPDNINRYYNRITGEVSSSKKEGYYDRLEGVISLSRNIKTFGLNNIINDYKLELKDIKNIGLDNSFDNEINKKNYVCTYRVTDNAECKCPEDTKNAGNSVYSIKSYVEDNNTVKQTLENMNVKESCVELQDKYCNYEAKDEYCKNCDGSKVNISECVKKEQETKTYEEAYEICREKTTCNTGTCNDYCTLNCTNTDKVIGNTVYTIQRCNNNTEICEFYVHCKDDRETSPSYIKLISERLNITNIVASLRNGLNISNLEDAIRMVDENVCGIKTAPKVLYRTIDLNNPFLTKNGQAREAGYNWDSEKIIKNKITNARNVEGDRIFTKEPLITITLTPNSIKKIRQYNSNNKYNNNTLNCNGNNVAGCISEFIHGDSNSLKSMGILNGITSCTNLNTNSSLSSFNACYNSNN